MSRRTASNFSDDLLNLFMEGLSIPPDAVPEPIDPGVVGNAASWVVFQIYYQIQAMSENFDVPGDILWKVVVDWLVSDEMGWERTPAEYCIPQVLLLNLPTPGPYSVS